MKKISMIISAVFVMAAFASCKKDHTCTCSFEITGTSSTTTTKSEMPKSTQKDAKAACTALETQMKASAGVNSVSCSL